MAKSGKEDSITLDLLNEYVYYKDGELYYKKKHLTANRVGERAGCYAKDGYYRVSFMGRIYLGHRLIFFMFNNYFPKYIDHIDRNPSNCRIENLREATASENGCNCTKQENCLSKYIGVTFHKNRTSYKRWACRIRINHKITYIGTYETEIEAALAYNEAAIKHHKEFANLNVIV